MVDYREILSSDENQSRTAESKDLLFCQLYLGINMLLLSIHRKFRRRCKNGPRNFPKFCVFFSMNILLHVFSVRVYT